MTWLTWQILNLGCPTKSDNVTEWALETAVNLNASIYLKHWPQPVKLPDHNLLTKYLPLKKADLKASSVVADPNACGQRDTTLSWFWSLDVQGDMSGNDWMTECECPESHVLSS
jgi:hypothetical protein